MNKIIKKSKVTAAKKAKTKVFKKAKKSDWAKAKTTLDKILIKDGAAKILAKNGVPCLSCPMASMEIDVLEIGKVCKIYRLNLAKILKELNALA